MSKISSYPAGTPTADDKVLFTDVSNGNATRNATVSELLSSGVSTGADSVVIDVIYDSDVNKGTPLYVTGYNQGQGATTVDIADADVAANMPVIGLADANYSANDKGTAIILGDLGGLNTNLFSVNDILYVNSGGGLTNQRPTNPDALIQNVGIVMRSNVSNGSVKVSALGRSNAVPNLQANNLFWSYINASGGVDQQVVHSRYVPRPLMIFRFSTVGTYTVNANGGPYSGDYAMLVDDVQPNNSAQLQALTGMSLVNSGTDEARVRITKPGIYRINVCQHISNVTGTNPNVTAGVGKATSATGYAATYTAKIQDRVAFGSSDQIFAAEGIFTVSAAEVTGGNELYVLPLFNVSAGGTYDWSQNPGISVPLYYIECLGWDVANTDMTAGGTIDPTQ
jgi:hypothetical protein